jgi:hypothetical protein
MIVYLLFCRLPVAILSFTLCVAVVACRGSPVLVVLQEPAEDLDADEAMADSPLAAGWPGTYRHSILEL